MSRGGAEANYTNRLNRCRRQRLPRNVLATDWIIIGRNRQVRGSNQLAISTGVTQDLGASGLPLLDCPDVDETEPFARQERSTLDAGPYRKTTGMMKRVNDSCVRLDGRPFCKWPVAN